MPLQQPPRGLVSYQHGTITNRADAPSGGKGTESLPVAALFAGNGYAYLAPDYLGLGSGPGLHPYLHAESEATATLDLLRAARSPELAAWARPVDFTRPLFLAGFSQGAHASIATLRAAESEPERVIGDVGEVAAVAAIAGPHALSEIQIPHTVDANAATGSGAIYLGFLLSAYHRIYGDSPLREIVREPYAERLLKIFDGSADDAALAGLPATGAELVTPEFAAAQREGWLARALVDNDPLNWTPTRPVTLYFGTAVENIDLGRLIASR